MWRDSDDQTFVRVMRAVNSQWGSGRRMAALKNYLRTKTPGLFMRLKAGYGRIEDEKTWMRLLTPLERDDLRLVRYSDPAPEAIVENRRLNAQFLASKDPVKSINWFIPAMVHPLYGGVQTILRFASRLQDSHGVEARIVLFDYGYSDLDQLRKRMEAAFPKSAPQVFFYPNQGSEEAPAADVCVASSWPSAYLVTRLHNTRAKFYMIQDYEPLFYEAGTRFGLADATYRLGLLRLVNSPGLLDWIQKLHGEGGTAFVPSVDASLYYPDNAELKDRPYVKIFFYGRPNNARNGFILGIEALKRLKQRYGERVRIVAAGEDWDPRTYGAGGLIENLGRLTTAREVAQLYRSCDVGLVFMFTPHPSYQPLEFMASGCAVVTNENSANQWLLRHEENALLCEPTLEAVVQALGRLVEDDALRRRLREVGLKSVAQKNWDDTIDEACRCAGLLRA